MENIVSKSNIIDPANTTYENLNNKDISQQNLLQQQKCYQNNDELSIQQIQCQSVRAKGPQFHMETEGIRNMIKRSPSIISAQSDDKSVKLHMRSQKSDSKNYNLDQNNSSQKQQGIMDYIIRQMDISQQDNNDNDISPIDQVDESKQISLSVDLREVQNPLQLQLQQDESQQNIQRVESFFINKPVSLQQNSSQQQQSSIQQQQQQLQEFKVEEEELQSQENINNTSKKQDEVTHYGYQRVGQGEKKGTGVSSKHVGSSYNNLKHRSSNNNNNLNNNNREDSTLYSFSDEETGKRHTIFRGRKMTERQSQRHDAKVFKIVGEDYSQMIRNSDFLQKKMQTINDLKKNKTNFKNRQSAFDPDSKHYINFFLINRIRKRFLILLENTESRRLKKFINLNLYPMVNDQSIVNKSNDDEMDDQFMEDENCSHSDLTKAKSRNKSFKYKSTYFFKIEQTWNGLVRFFHYKWVTIKNLFRNPKVFQPQDTLVSVINILSALGIISICFVYSIHIAYKFDITTSDIYFYLKYYGMVIFVLDILIRFNTAVYVKGEVISERSEISKHYKKDGALYFDIIALAPQVYNLFYVDNTLMSYIMEALFVFKLITFRQIWNKIERQFYIYGEKSYLFSFVELLFKLIVISHIIGVMWNQLAEVEMKYWDIHDSWVQVMGIEDKGWHIRWMESFYWAAATMMLVGTKGNNFVEVLFCSVVMFLTVGLFGYLISSINIILDELNQKKKDYQKDLEVVNKYLRNKSVTEDLQSRVRNYLEYLYRASGDMSASSEVSQVLKKLPKNIKNDINIEINSGYLYYFTFIYSHFSDKILDQLVFEMEEKYYVPNEIIFKQGEQEDIAYYLVAKGQVQLYMERDNGNNDYEIKNAYEAERVYSGNQQGNKKHHLQKHKKGIKIKELGEREAFGHNAFCSGLSYQYTARSTKFSTVYRIKRSTFMKLIKGNKMDYEKFCLIKDQLIVNGLSKFSQKECYICHNSMQHCENQCNVIQYNPAKLNLIEKYEYSQPNNERNFQLRPFRKRVNAKYSLYDIQFIVKEVVQDDKQLRPKILDLQKIYEKSFVSMYDEEEDIDDDSEEDNENTFSQLRELDEEEEDDYSSSEEEDSYNTTNQNNHNSSKNYNMQLSRRTSVQSRKSMVSSKQSRRMSLSSQATRQKKSSMQMDSSYINQSMQGVSEIGKKHQNKRQSNADYHGVMKVGTNISAQKLQAPMLNLRKKNCQDLDEKKLQRVKDILSKAQKQAAQILQGQLSLKDINNYNNSNLSNVLGGEDANYNHQGAAGGQNNFTSLDKGAINKQFTFETKRTKIRFVETQIPREKELNKLQTNMNHAQLHEVLFKVFDKQREFHVYNPQNNISRVLSKYKHYMRWKLKKQRNKKYKLFSTKYRSFKSIDYTDHMNLRTTVRNPKTNAITRTIINQKAMQFHNQLNNRLQNHNNNKSMDE